MIDLKRAKEICEAATPGPWVTTHNGQIRHGAMRPTDAIFGASSLYPENAKFIAYARTALPEAIEEIEALERLDTANQVDLVDLRKRLSLAEAVCEAASSRQCGPVGCCCTTCTERKVRLEKALQAWREGSK